MKLGDNGVLETTIEEWRANNLKSDELRAKAEMYRKQANELDKKYREEVATDKEKEKEVMELYKKSQECLLEATRCLIPRGTKEIKFVK